MIKNLVIGIGLGGTRMAAELVKTSNGCCSGIFMNISKLELEAVSEDIEGERYIIGNSDGGSGKDRSFAKKVFNENFNSVDFLGKLRKRIIKDEIDIITVSYSVGGGTGSGLGPMMVNFLTANIEKDEKFNAISLCTRIYEFYDDYSVGSLL